MKKNIYKLASPLGAVGKIAVGAGVAVLLVACSQVGRPPDNKELAALETSPNYVNGKFVNGIPAIDPPIFTALKEWVRGGRNTVPSASSPVVIVKRSKEELDAPPKSGLRITWVGHSTSLVEIDGVRLLLDPVWAERSSPISWAGPKRFFPAPFKIDDLPQIDAVLISHDHYDHLDKDTVIRLSKTGCRFLVPLGVGSRLKSWDIPPSKIEELDWWEASMVEGVRVTATPARHFSGRSLVMADRNKTLWAGFAIAGEKHRVYYSGDTGMFPGFQEIGDRLGPFDASLIEIGAYHRLWADLHLGPEQAILAAKKVRGGLLIPVHWATFDLALHSWVEPAERLIVAAEKENHPIAIPKPGQSIEPENPAPLVRWWPNVPWQTAEEHPIISSGMVPSTSE